MYLVLFHLMWDHVTLWFLLTVYWRHWLWRPWRMRVRCCPGLASSYPPSPEWPAHLHISNMMSLCTALQFIYIYIILGYYECCETINRMLNKVCVYIICVCTVYIYYKYKHIQYIFKKNMLCLYVKCLCILWLYTCMFVFLYIHNKYTLYTYII